MLVRAHRGGSALVRRSANGGARTHMRTPYTQRGFTLVELIVTILLLGVVAGMIVPRMRSGSSRQAEAAARSIAAMLSVAAQHVSMSGEHVAIEYSAEKGEVPSIGLLTRRVRGEGVGLRDVSTAWAPDPFVAPISFEVLALDGAVIDGRHGEETGWRVVMVPGRARPTIELVVKSVSARRAKRDQRGGKAWIVSLLPDASRATIRRTTGGTAGGDAGLRVVDLDAIGMRERAW